MSKMMPARDPGELAQRHELFRSIEEYRDMRGELPWNFRLSSVGPTLEDAKSSGMLIGEELLRIRRLLEGSARIKDVLVAARPEWPVFSLLIKDLRDFSSEIEALSVIDDDGRLFDRASDRLRRLREDMRKIRDRIRAKGRGILSDPSLSSMLQERVLTLRNGRHAVLVRQDAISGFPGLVMDRSGSGNSVYMEPHALVGLNNEHAVCAESENAEERRILHALTERMLSREAGIIDAEAVLGRIDMFYAMSEKIRRDKWRMPMLTASPSFRFHMARHPLLGESATPIDISCGEKFRILVITGPNTGGKTVALKTAGVCVCLGWLGCPIPAEEDSVLGVIDDIYSDIGDEQSIEQNLSTFSAHVSQITKILSRAGERSVVLLDELGSGTDPEEGAALGIAILDWLEGKKSLVLATTHHNPIKRYALSSPGVESASVEFNVNTLSPTYRLLIGIPGRSNALLIAGKLGMPRSVLERARSALHHREASMEDIIGELQEKRTAIERESMELEAMKDSLGAMRRDYERQLAEFTEKRDRLLADADKKALGIVENAENSAKSLIKTIDAEARSAARRKLERTKKHFGMIKEQAESREEERLERAYAPDEKPLEVGGSVVVIGTSTVGELEAIEGDKATIIAGAARLELPLKMLRSADREENRREKRAQRAGRKKGITIAMREGPAVRIIPPPPPTGVPSSIMIRGMTLDEAIPLASQYLDRAYRAGYGEVSIIHGRGEGILRREVHSLCGSLPYVESFRLGETGEGGFGVTIVRFRT
ncbi:MAG: Smr/MutS family protein [Synergistaceae bacterium]|nr:Smr/MutS family protein [Synergistaceae bacterium]